MALVDRLRLWTTKPMGVTGAVVALSWVAMNVIGVEEKSTIDNFQHLLSKGDVITRALAGFLSLGVTQLVCGVSGAVFLAGSAVNHDGYAIDEIARVVTPLLIFNLGIVPWATGPEPFDVFLWWGWFTLYSCIAGVNALIEKYQTHVPPQAEHRRGRGSYMDVEGDVALTAITLLVNNFALVWLLSRAGFAAFTPMVMIKWCHEGWKELIKSMQIVCRIYLRSRPEGSSGFIFGHSVQQLEFEIESWGKIAWRVVHLLSGAYVLWADGLSTLVVNTMMYFRMRSSWRILGVEISKRLSRADMDAQIDRVCPETKLTEKDECAICWEQMPTASVLPCQHRFHRDCLRRWVKDQSTCPTCPTCRRSINVLPVGRLRDGFWHDAVRRLFSLGGPTPQEIEEMSAQLHAVFPHVAIAVIEQDLVLTGSLEMTADRLTRFHVH